MTLTYLEPYPRPLTDDANAPLAKPDVVPEIWDRLRGYSVISFDVFETLLYREGVFRPIDLFLEMGKRAAPELGLSPADFARLRMRAERDARSGMARRMGQEVLLAEIYDRLNALLPTTGRAMASTETLKSLAQIEIDVELAHLRSLPSVADIYHRAIAAGKTVVLVSDFYAPASFVEKALAVNGFDAHHALFVSSELDLTKHHGDLYAHVCDTLGVSPRDIVHLGDNPWSDGSRSLQSGIAHLRINNPVHAMTARWQLDWRAPAEPLPSAISAYQAERLYGTGLDMRRPADMDVLERVGRESLGPLLLGLVGWLYAGIGERPLPTVHFCARDGLIMKKAFDLYQARHGRRVDTRYLMVSRQVIYRARAVSEPDAAQGLFSQNWARLTPGEALSRWGLDPSAFDQQIRSAGFLSAGDAVATGDDAGAARFEALFEACREDLQAANAEHAALFQDYLRQAGVSGADDVLLVDIGWHGSLQKGLTQVLRADGWTGQLAGRYLGLFLNDAALAGFDAGGYLFSHDGTPRAKALRSSPSLVELLHTAGHGSTAGYVRAADGRIEPRFEERPDEERQHAEAIAPIQDAALAFVEDMLSNSRLGPDPLAPADAFRGLDRLLNRPTSDEVNVIGQFRIAANYGATAKSLGLTERSPEGHQLWLTEGGLI